MLTLRTKARRYPAWQYVVSALLCIPGLAVNGWIAHRFIGVDGRLALQWVIVCGVLIVAFLPLLYKAHEIRFRDRNPMVVPRTVAAFLTVFYLVLLYHINASGVFPDATPRRLTMVIMLIAMAAGMWFVVYGVRYELD